MAEGEPNSGNLSNLWAHYEQFAVECDSWVRRRLLIGKRLKKICYCFGEILCSSFLIFRHYFRWSTKNTTNKAQKRKFYTNSRIELLCAHIHTRAYNIRGEYVNRCATNQKNFICLFVVDCEFKTTFVITSVDVSVSAGAFLSISHSVKSIRFVSFCCVVCLCMCYEVSVAIHVLFVEKPSA